MDKRITLAIAVLLVLSVAPGVSAQSTTLSGQIIDQDGAPVAGVEVYLYQWGASSSPEKETCDADGACTMPAYDGQYYEAKTVSDADGRYSLAAQNAWASLNFNKPGYAGHFESLEITADQVLDVQMLKYPAKTAHITGTITGGGKVLPYAGVSAESPLYGLHECSVIAGDTRGGGGVLYEESASESGGSGSADASRSIAPGEPYPGDPGCAITIQKDGSFDAMVTPGYTILRFHHQDWRVQGGQEYYGKSLVRDLSANATTRLDVDLKARPAPNAIIEGYIVDGATKTAIGGVYVNFGSMDNYGWASAQTDKEGSYKVSMRAGLVQVSVYAEGYLPWEGDVMATADGSVRFDIHLTAGQSRYGGCCIAYAEGGKTTMAGVSDGQEAAPGSPRVGASVEGDEAQRGTAFNDLGGGLGPYDARSAPSSGDADAGEPVVKDTPGFEIIALALGLLAVVLLRRK